MQKKQPLYALPFLAPLRASEGLSAGFKGRFLKRKAKAWPHEKDAHFRLFLAVLHKVKKIIKFSIVPKGLSWR